jgi:hypothetical protein
MTNKRSQLTYRLLRKHDRAHSIAGTDRPVAAKASGDAKTADSAAEQVARLGDADAGSLPRGGWRACIG